VQGESQRRNPYVPRCLARSGRSWLPALSMWEARSTRRIVGGEVCQRAGNFEVVGSDVPASRKRPFARSQTIEIVCGQRDGSEEQSRKEIISSCSPTRNTLTR
jgi:hypothetical protein